MCGMQRGLYHTWGIHAYPSTGLHYNPIDLQRLAKDRSGRSCGYQDPSYQSDVEIWRDGGTAKHNVPANLQRLAKDTYGSTITLARHGAYTAYSAYTAIPTARTVLLAIHREVLAPPATMASTES